MQNYNMLMTNDDGIESPGLKAAVEAVLDIGTVTVLGPSGQQTATGRGLTGDMQSSFTPNPGKREVKPGLCLVPP